MAITYSNYVPDPGDLLTNVTDTIDGMMTLIDATVTYCSENATNGIITITDATNFMNNVRTLRDNLYYIYALNGYPKSQTLKSDISTEYIGDANVNIKNFIIDYITIYNKS